MLLAPLLLLLGEAAEEKAAPVIDIDGTVIVQFAIFLVMYFVLRSLLFRPYLEMRAQRSAGIDGARAEADAMERRASEIMKDYEQRLAAARLRSEEERSKLRGQGQEREREVLAEARSVASLKIQAARKQLAEQTQAAAADLQRQAQPLAQAIASKILGRAV